MARNELFTPRPNLALGRYQHYKGNFYKVLELACHTETHEWYVVYQALYDFKDNPGVWVRPYKMFSENIEINGKTVPRFKKVDETR